MGFFIYFPETTPEKQNLVCVRRWDAEL
jgi:A1 cistron-splicing factor AAR2